MSKTTTNATTQQSIVRATNKRERATRRQAASRGRDSTVIGGVICTQVRPDDVWAPPNRLSAPAPTSSARDVSTARDGSERNVDLRTVHLVGSGRVNALETSPVRCHRRCCRHCRHCSSRRSRCCCRRRKKGAPVRRRRRRHRRRCHGECTDGQPVQVVVAAAADGEYSEPTKRSGCGQKGREHKVVVEGDATAGRQVWAMTTQRSAECQAHKAKKTVFQDQRTARGCSSSRRRLKLLNAPPKFSLANWFARASTPSGPLRWAYGRHCSNIRAARHSSLRTILNHAKARAPEEVRVTPLSRATDTDAHQSSAEQDSLPLAQ
jgi:hypothetical protein